MTEQLSPGKILDLISSVADVSFGLWLNNKFWDRPEIRGHPNPKCDEVRILASQVLMETEE